MISEENEDSVEEHHRSKMPIQVRKKMTIASEQVMSISGITPDLDDNCSVSDGDTNSNANNSRGFNFLKTPAEKQADKQFEHIKNTFKDKKMKHYMR